MFAIKIKTVFRQLGLAMLLVNVVPVVVAFDCLPAPALSEPTGNIVEIGSEAELQNAMGSLQPDTTLLLAPGTYVLSSTLYIRAANVTVRGEADDCDSVRLIGKGMENSDYGNVPHGIWTDATGLNVQNLSIEDVYLHSIMINPGAGTPHLYNLRLANAGQQFVKANPYSFGNGVDGGVVEYSVLEYTDGPPTTDHGGGTGYTNGVDVHGGADWIIRNNLFANFHTDDTADNLWNPAVLMWNGSSGTLVENNRFMNVDRAISFGLIDRDNDHRGGLIRNNMIAYTEGLYSDQRKAASDATIILWDSPDTGIYHNTVLTNGNLSKSIELRFNTSGSVIKNNLLDAPIGSRDGGDHSASQNSFEGNAGLFFSPDIADLHLLAASTGVMNSVSSLPEAQTDFDGQIRSDINPVDFGADEYLGISPPMPPTDLQIVQ
ncbi:hypothetical protein [Marinobacter changyiensis]|uniref:hypothetical protein n=1 Tax=Marinobacter changyiensis TaxID=2604091 RepID=UPI001264F37C|nr:hypothetical protein [Marinobacter changyiensis]